MAWMSRALAGLVLALAAFGAAAQSSTSGSGSGGYSGPGADQVLSTVCTECMFPITVGGVPEGDASKVPLFASHQSVCYCKNILGVPIPGLTYGMWIPQRIIETVRAAYDSPTFGRNLSGSSGSGQLNANLRGGVGSGEHGTNKIGFSNMHTFLYPIGKIMDGVLEMLCLSDTSGGADMVYASEIDPSWSDDSISMILTPEASIFANQSASMSCIADSAAADVYQPLEWMIWCMGSWGTAYPQNGETATTEPVRQAAYAAAKATAMLQRRAMIWDTMGDDALCEAYPNPIFSKTMYRLEQVWPNPETVSNHWIGTDPNLWGEWRYMPYTGEDFVQVEFQFLNCCIY